MTEYDVIITNGLVFDGSNRPPVRADLGIKDGKVSSVSKAPLSSNDANTRVIDAKGCWVTPGFLDTHTHYDAEVIAAPALKESVRHGVTTVTVGSCSISMVLNPPEDCADLFTRVESVPREHVLPLLSKEKKWNSPGEYVEFMGHHPLGPNITSFLGHSELRSHVMGLGRAVDPKAKPSESEFQKMEELLEDALNHGFLGLSTMTTDWDKLDGDRYRSASLPSTYAKWGEFRRLNKILRKRNRIHQGAPNIVTKVNMFLFLGESIGLGRKPLKTTLISMMDIKANPFLVGPVSLLTRFLNRVLKADFRWQALPNPFEVYADGVDLVIFEEFGSGQAALHLKSEIERNALMQQESYRRWFRKDYANKWGPRVWQRNFDDAYIVSCPDASLVGKSFGQIAVQKQLHPVDVFLDLVVEFGTRLRWHTVIANHRERVLKKIVNDPSTVISFADSGAHIRNMAFYNFPLRLLKMAWQSQREGRPIMTIEKAVHRLTGELADWFGIDAGFIKEGGRADIAVINPEGLRLELDAYYEAPIDEFGGIERMVNRNDEAVKAVLVNGKIAWEEGVFADDLGKNSGYGQFLKARDTGHLESAR